LKIRIIDTSGNGWHPFGPKRDSNKIALGAGSQELKNQRAAARRVIAREAALFPSPVDQN